MTKWDRAVYINARFPLLVTFKEHNTTIATPGTVDDLFDKAITLERTAEQFYRRLAEMFASDDIIFMVSSREQKCRL